MTAAAIETWQQQHPGIDPYKEDSYGPGFTFQPPHWYHCEVLGAHVDTSKSQDKQIVLKLAVKDGDDHTAGEVLHFLQLPCQASDSRFPQDKIAKITYRRRDEICRLLQCVGVVSPDEKAPAKYEQTLKWCAEHLGVEDGFKLDLDGVSFYLETKPNKNKPEYPYLTIRRELGKGADLYTGDEAPF